MRYIAGAWLCVFVLWGLVIVGIGVPEVAVVVTAGTAVISAIELNMRTRR